MVNWEKTGGQASTWLRIAIFNWKAIITHLIWFFYFNYLYHQGYNFIGYNFIYCSQCVIIRKESSLGRIFLTELHTKHSRAKNTQLRDVLLSGQLVRFCFNYFLIFIFSVPYPYFIWLTTLTSLFKSNKPLRRRVHEVFWKACCAKSNLTRKCWNTDKEKSLKKKKKEKKP